MSGRKDVGTLFFATATFCLFADLASKYLIWRTIAEPDGEIRIIPGWVSLIRRLNTGGIWSLFHDFESANLALAGFSTVAVAAILWLAWSVLQSGQRFLPVLLGGILGGAIGNLYDRWMLGGVRDWIDCDLQFYRWPTFNLADSFLVCGAIGLFFHSLLTECPTSNKPANSNCSTSSAESTNQHC